MKTRTITLLAVLTAGIAAVGTADAAVISWGSATNTSGKADLIEGDTVVYAFGAGPTVATVTNGGAGGATTYAFTASNFASLPGGVTFAGTGGDAGDTTQVRETNPYDGGSISTTGDANFDSVIDGVTDAYGTPSGIVTGGGVAPAPSRKFTGSTQPVGWPGVW